MVKIDVISGFLGSGKTTFIKKMLDTCTVRSERVVVIENDFGEIGIDGTLLSCNGIEVYEISAGCLCCSLRQNFTHTLAEILAKVNPERIIIEPSGIFVLSEIYAIVNDPLLSARCQVNSIITIVDSVNYIEQNEKYAYFFENQIQHADTLILSKSQLVSKEDIEKIAAAVQCINPQATIFTINWDEMTETNMLQIRDKTVRSPVTSRRYRRYRQGIHKKWESFSLHDMEAVTYNDLDGMLASLRSSEYGDIVRGKGFVNTGGNSFEFSYVNGRYTITQTNHSEAMACFIGEGINGSKLVDLFAKKCSSEKGGS
jgi:G3E family GTPase